MDLRGLAGSVKKSAVLLVPVVPSNRAGAGCVHDRIHRGGVEAATSGTVLGTTGCHHHQLGLGVPGRTAVGLLGTLGLQLILVIGGVPGTVAGKNVLIQ